MAGRRPRIYVTGPIPTEISIALGADFEIAATIDGVDGVLSLVTTSIDDSFMETAGDRLRIVANYGVGLDNVDLDAARRRKITVTNTPDVLTRATAELTLTLILSLLRRVVEGDRFLRTRAPWQFGLEFMLGESLEGKRVAIVGAGRIGRETARLVEAFGASVDFVRRQDSLDAALARADVVSLHCPLTASTRHLIDERRLDQMQAHAVLVNTARGPIVDEGALVIALRENRIAGAALDVYEYEPQVSESLLELENVVLSPHLGSATRSTRLAMGRVAVDALREALVYGVVPRNAVT